QITGFQKPISEKRYPYTYAQHHCTIWADLLDAEISYGQASWGGAEVYFYLGSDYAGEDAFNMFGGVSEGVYDQMLHFINHDAEYFSLGFDLPDIGAQIKKRIGNPSCYKEFTEEMCDKISEKCKETQTVLPQDLVKDTDGSILFGDSHSLSMVPFKTPVVKIIGKTLHGALKDCYLQDLVKTTKATNISFMFGSIDIRHHIFRQEDPYKAMDVLIDDYTKQCKEIEKTGKIIEICSPVVTEFEGRKLPKTGYFKGTPFAGTRKERNDMTRYFIDRIQKSGLKISEYPEKWFKMDGELYASKIMERPSNTHVALPYSRCRDFGENKNEMEEW
ncbi:MAG: hypothetical protein J7L15_03195, partial [Clostridiales bacterium]|nr:hypothetical protein [Clostridiales bacterium]